MISGETESISVRASCGSILVIPLLLFSFIQNYQYCYYLAFLSYTNIVVLRLEFLTKTADAHQQQPSPRVLVEPRRVESNLKNGLNGRVCRKCKLNPPQGCKSKSFQLAEHCIFAGCCPPKKSNKNRLSNSNRKPMKTAFQRKVFTERSSGCFIPGHSM